MQNRFATRVVPGPGKSPLVTTAVHEFVIGAPAPVISGEAWINSKPITIDALKGHVVLVEFWTYA